MGWLYFMTVNLEVLTKNFIPKTEENNSTLTSQRIPFFLNVPLQAVTCLSPGVVLQ